MNARTDQIIKYNPVYDCIRGAAAMMVFVGHSAPLWRGISGLQLNTDIVNALLFMSVEFFFALSGVLLGPILYRQFQKEEPLKNIKVFLLRRWYRTLPTFYIGLLFWIFLYISLSLFEEDEAAQVIPPYFVFVQNLFGQFDIFFNVAWSISIEEIFYVVFVFIAGLCFLKLRDAGQAFKASILLIIAFSFVMRAMELQDFANWDAEIRKASLLRLDSIVVGAWVGIFCTHLTRRSYNVALAFILGVMAYLSVYWNAIDASITHALALQVLFTFLPFACAVMVMYLAQNWALKPTKPIRFFADISYPLYIFHLALVPFFFNIGLEASYLLLMAYMIGTIGFCYLFFKYIETPILKRRPRYEE